MTTAAALILAAGSATRMAPGPNKPFRPVAGHALLWYSVAAFTAAQVPHVVIVARPEDFDSIEPGLPRVAGGPTRTASEHAGLAAVADLDVDVVLIHDAARPFVTPDLIARTRRAASEVGGAVPVLAPEVPLWRRRDSGLEAAPPGLMRVQTPQAFRAPELHTAYRQAAGADVTAADTAEIVERFSDLEIATVPGDPIALKVTYESDLDRLEAAVAEWQRAMAQFGNEDTKTAGDGRMSP